MHLFVYLVITLSLKCLSVRAKNIPWHETKGHLPGPPSGVTKLTLPHGVKITYKQPGKHGVCETKKGVDDYAGYVSLDDRTNVFFWYFDARDKPEDKPVTLWLNGGPGSDSLVGLFQEHGPCTVTEDLKTKWNPYSWNEVSNMLYLSQPVGVGFSWESKIVGHHDNETGLVNATSVAESNGRWPLVDPDRTNTTEAAAVGAWHILQALMGAKRHSGKPIIPRTTFNLWTESYGGHYGPVFYNYFRKQNDAILNGSTPGHPLSMHTLGIINGCINAKIQIPRYREMAVNNTYGIKALNDSMYTFMKQTWEIPYGCRDQLDDCADNLEKHPTSEDTFRLCSASASACNAFTESPYYDYSKRGAYDIRVDENFSTPESWKYFLNLQSTQEVLGVDLNYTSGARNVSLGFERTGDPSFPNALKALEEIVDSGSRVVLQFGDADYICNWFGGEAVSLELNYTRSKEFRAAGYAPIVFGGTEYGAVREYGNFSFTRLYKAGHMTPYYQPLATLEIFRRALANLDISEGRTIVTDDYATNGTAKAEHTEASPPPP